VLSAETELFRPCTGVQRSAPINFSKIPFILCVILIRLRQEWGERGSFIPIFRSLWRKVILHYSGSLWLLYWKCFGQVLATMKGIQSSDTIAKAVIKLVVYGAQWIVHQWHSRIQTQTSLILANLRMFGRRVRTNHLRRAVCSVYTTYTTCKVLKR